MSCHRSQTRPQLRGVANHGDHCHERRYCRAGDGAGHDLRYKAGYPCFAIKDDDEIHDAVLKGNGEKGFAPEPNLVNLFPPPSGCRTPDPVPAVICGDRFSACPSRLLPSSTDSFSGPGSKWLYAVTSVLLQAMRNLGCLRSASVSSPRQAVSKNPAQNGRPIFGPRDASNRPLGRSPRSFKDETGQQRHAAR